MHTNAYLEYLKIYIYCCSYDSVVIESGKMKMFNIEQLYHYIISENRKTLMYYHL
jgi:hypothetical protein